MSSQIPFKKHIYKHNSIQEAIFEIKGPVDNWDSSVPGRFYERVRKDFPTKSDVQSVSFVVRSSAGPPPPVQAPIMKARSKDRSKYLQIGPGLMTVNCLKYTHWPEFRDSIAQAVAAYMEVSVLSALTSLSIRYINRFEFEQETVNLGEYFVFGVFIPETIRDIHGFQCIFHNQVEPKGNMHGRRNTTKFFTRPTRLQSSENPLFLDIRASSLGTIEATSQNILEIAEQFHEVVEGIFESFLTDKLRARLGVHDV